MSEAIITGIVAIIVCVINNWALMAKQNALIEYKINELTEKVQKHNQLIERTFKLEETSALHAAELNRLNKRLEIVEDKKHE